MRVVIDTGVLLSAAFKERSTPNRAVYEAEQIGTLLKSDPTEAELVDVIDRPYLAKLIAPAARDRLLKLMAAAEPVIIIERFTACRDTKDDKFLELAVNGGADFIVTGDKDMLVLDPFRGIPILGPAEFLRSLVS